VRSEVAAPAQRTVSTLRRQCSSILVAAAVIGLGGCGGHSAASEDSVARSVPVPLGLTFTGINDQTSQVGLGPATHEANAVYTNPLMPCSQLRSEWVAALRSAHWTINDGESTSSQIFSKHHGYTVMVSLNSVTTCNQSIVTVQ
jgi:hypothetical protein